MVRIKISPVAVSKDKKNHGKNGVVPNPVSPLATSLTDTAMDKSASGVDEDDEDMGMTRVTNEPLLSSLGKRSQEEEEEDEASKKLNDQGENSVNKINVKAEVNRKSTEPAEAEKARAPWFVFLMVQLGHSCKNEAKIIIAREAYRESYRHNSGEINDKGTKAAKGLWTPDLCAGPFKTWEAAERFKELCTKKSRSIIPRRERFVDLVQSEELIQSGVVDADIKCFDKRLVPLYLNQWLVDNNMECLQLPEERLASLYLDCVRTVKTAQAYTNTALTVQIIAS